MEWKRHSNDHDKWIMEDDIEHAKDTVWDEVLRKKEGESKLNSGETRR